MRKIRTPVSLVVLLLTACAALLAGCGRDQPRHTPAQLQDREMRKMQMDK